MKNRYISTAQIVIFATMHNLQKEKIDQQLRNFDMKLYRFDTIVHTSKNLYKEFLFPKITLEVYEYDNTLYLLVYHLGDKFYLQDNGLKKFNSIYYFIFFTGALGILAVVYFVFIKKDIENKKARDLFIANIMHELKTPITKGKLTITLLNDEKNVKRLDKVFTRLETLVNEFAFIEELTGNYQIQKRKYRLNDIVDNAIDLLLEDTNIDKSFQEKTLYVNYNLLSICIKNILDNGIKHTKDKKIILFNDEESILCFKTKGEKLSKPLSFYTQPFTKGKESKSFGLGLYIVKYILDFHNMKLEYKFQDGYNYFSIV